MSGKVYRIVLVEDNDADVYLFREALTSAGLAFEITVIEDGGQAMEFAQGHGQHGNGTRPDLTVLDLNLPQNAGTEVLEALRKNSVLAKIPVVVMSSSSAPSEKALASHLGVSRFITKPAHFEEYVHIGEVIKALLVENEEKPLEAASFPESTQV